MSEGRLFEPDVLITDQFVTARRRRSALSSEKRLMLAVLENALDDYQKYVRTDDRVGRALFADAAAWIACTSNEDLFSFEHISETLDINPSYFRRGVAAWHQRLLTAPRRTVGVTAESPQAAVESPDLAQAAS
jgi:inosine-uridine nucleoside N-ribohydrolase